MKTYYKISIPKPCHEDWNAMTPNTKGRFCSVCTKTVVDFTTKSNEEIQNLFRKNGKLCGRFKKSQLEGLTLTVPSHILHQHYSFRKSFLLAIFITMGTTLISCTNMEGKPQTINTVTVIENGEVDTLKANIQVSDSLKKSCTTTVKDSDTVIETPVPDHKDIEFEEEILFGIPVYEPIPYDKSENKN